MKSKTLTHFASRFSKGNKDSNMNLDKNRVKVEIENICSQHLESGDDVLQFEVNEKDLDFVVSILETGLISKYEIYQVDRTLFNASLREVDLL